MTRWAGRRRRSRRCQRRRTVYGKVSRYRLDEFLQLFDFPSPMQSAERRFATNVPLQRLFLMNSDFMQQQAERLAERVVALPTDAERIEKAYRLIFGRKPTPAELTAGLEFLTTEPMRQYEEKKAEEAKKAEDVKKAAEAAAKAAAMPEPSLAHRPPRPRCRRRPHRQPRHRLRPQPRPWTA